MSTPGSDAWIGLLASIVPAEPAAGLLRAMLWDGAAARAEWLAWTKSVGDPRKFFERDYRGRKGLLAFLGHRLSENDVDAGQDFATYARVAQVREELRSRIFIDTLHTVQSSMESAGLEPILVNGAAYAFTVYSQPLVRHSHGIDLLLPADQLGAGNRAAAAAGFRLQRTATLPRGVLETYVHGTGLELTLRSQLYLAPHAKNEPAGFRSRCEQVAVEQSRVRVLAPADRLCHTLGEGAAAPTHGNLRWACDAYLLLRRTKQLDFDAVVAMAVEIGTALPTAVLLEFFQAELGVEIPARVLAELRTRGAPRGACRSNLLLSTVLRTSASVGEFVRRARAEPGLFHRAARFALFPSAEHIAYQRRPAAKWKIPFLYVTRVGRVIARRLRWLRTLRMAA
jgi:Uncharacterised nucleotidyltransferase